MYNFKLFLLSLTLLLVQSLNAQELKAKVSVNASRIPSTIDKKVFQTLQTALTNFINTRKWTSDVFQPTEKIECNFSLTLTQLIETGVYQASLTIQAARPVYNSSYVSPLVNYQDNDITFKYTEYQPVEFNESNVQGNDPTASNLTAVFAYYVYMILGFDYDSFSARGGDPYFQKAQNIVNSAPEARGITGWKPFDGTRNRYWLMENVTNSRYSLFHDAMYNYYRNGMDKMYDDVNAARRGVLESLQNIDNINAEVPNTMIVQFFFQGKANELVKVFSKANGSDKSRALELLQKLDVSNTALYKQELK
ncbi:MAG: DUF4835 family protein [Sphingobacteriales bacterium]|nr:DUF4835 family protein [Sphingobacteriales bacterium]MBI3718831.1 DUF4835 family protein [Sphingobacteriales bacterium]